MKKSVVQSAIRAANRRAVIARTFGPRMNAGPLGATMAFKTDGDTVLEDQEFQSRVLVGIEAQQKQIKTLEQKQTEVLAAIPKDLKENLEQITKLQRVANDQSANVEALQKRLQLFEIQMRNHVRGAYGDPIRRIMGDEEMRLRLNAAVRLAVSNNGDMINGFAKKFPDFIKRALGEDSSPGSTLINQDLAGEIYSTLEMYGIWNTFRVLRLGTKTNILPVKTARAVAVAIISEGTQIPDDANKAGTTVTATVIDVAALLNVYLRLIEDAEFDVTADILDDFAEATAYRLDWFCTQADGTADTTDGGMTGIFGGGGTAVAAAAGNTTVETTDEADWRNTLLGVDAAVLQRPARWWLHPQILIRALAVKDNNGRSIFLNALEAPSAGAVGSILGYPVTLGAACPTTNAANAKVAVFGDPAGQVVGIRNDFSVATSDHHKWDYAMRSFRIIGRAATKIRRAQAFGVLTLPAA